MKKKTAKISLKLLMFLVLLSPVCLAADIIKNADDAILNVNVLTTDDEKKIYLIYQAQEFVTAERFDDAKKLADYVISNIDSKSEDAQKILDEVNQKVPEGDVNPVEINF